MNTVKTKRSLNSLKLFDYINYLFMLILMFFMLFPFYNTIVISFNDATDSIRGQVYFWPRQFSLYNYYNLFVNNNLFYAGLMSVYRTVAQTVINVFLSAFAAYILSRKDYVFRKAFTIFLVLTMYIDAGLIPTYMLYRNLKLINTFWVYIIPTALAAFNVIVIRTFMNELPESYAESARIDGAGDMRILMQILFPLCKPVLATVALWVAVGAWNSWYDTFLYAPSKQSLSTLQYEMMKLLSTAYSQSAAPEPGLKATAGQTITPTSMRAAITVVASVPIICVYPFLQKYFVKGIHLGGVKG